jgi:hypothetical protein
MKKLVLTALFFLFAGVFVPEARACSCLKSDETEKDPQKIRESVRNFYRNEFKGAVFTGRVLKVEKVGRKIDDDFVATENKVTVEVDKYWVGSVRPVMTVYTGTGGDCGVNFVPGGRYFFYPHSSEGRLRAGICDYVSNAAMEANAESVKNFSEILGPAKTFRKKVKRHRKKAGR